MEQLNAEKINSKNVHRAVESLITGKFHKVEKKFNPNVDTSLHKAIDTDGDGIEST